MLKYFTKKKDKFISPLLVDIHSHLLPGLDDGVKSVEESIYILRIMRDFGYKKVITTPHIMSDSYPNTPESILIKLEEVREAIIEHNIDIELEAAAEYYLDEKFLERITNSERLLTIGNNYLLFETSFLNKPFFLEEVIFKMNANGYQPVLAHPERYGYLQSNMKLVKKLKDMNLLFQLNLLSLTNYYSSEVRNFARELLKMDFIDFIGSDCHNALQANEILDKVTKKTVKRFNSEQIINNTLLDV